MCIDNVTELESPELSGEGWKVFGQFYDYISETYVFSSPFYSANIREENTEITSVPYPVYKTTAGERQLKYSSGWHIFTNKIDADMLRTGLESQNNIAGLESQSNIAEYVVYKVKWSHQMAKGTQKWSRLLLGCSFLSTSAEIVAAKKMTLINKEENVDVSPTGD